VQAADEGFVLKPGESRTAKAQVRLPQSGEWDIIGVCRCSYTQVRPTPVPKDDPLGQLTQRALPSPLLPESTNGENLTTPPVRVRAS
jgi:hypothetical protein